MAEIYVWNMDDCTWYAGATREDVIKAYSEDSGETAEEDYPDKLSSESMGRLMFHDDIYNQDTCPKRTFWEQLEKMKADGKVKFPCFFATTEY